MRHTRQEVIDRTIREFELLDALVANLNNEDWDRLVPRPEGKDSWTVKDALAHITHWKANITRRLLGQPVPAEERGLGITEGNYLVFTRWHNRPVQEVLAWHEQVHAQLLAALEAAPEAWFSAREHGQEWPYDLDGHSAYHRVRDIQRALDAGTPR